MDPRRADARVRSIVRSSRRLVWTTVVVYAAILAWSWLSVGPAFTTWGMLPALVFAFFSIAVVARRRMARASAARSPEEVRAFLHGHYATAVHRARTFGVVAPALLVVTWAGVLGFRVWRVHPPLLYWLGAAAVSVTLLVALIAKRRALPGLVRLRDELA